MLFSSIPFIYYFLPCVLITYFLTPNKFKNLTLLIFSLVFYAWGEPKYLSLMLLSIFYGYISGILIEKFKDTKFSKAVFISSIVFNLGMLGYFKYADFFISNFNSITGLSVPLLKIALPIGISFYTFQIFSYTIDVYRKDVPAQKNLISLATYITLFPQLIAGPIVRYSDVEKQLSKRNININKIAKGIRRFTLGLAKKILIANQLGELCDIFLSSNDKSVLFYWLYAVAFMLHIYFDFSGYSDMAIGLGKVLGFDFMENFNYPYISKSITEFWRRWHMSLGSWFRDYVYIPLGGNRVSKLRHIFNLFVVWFLTGFWHGASWNFIVWGLFFFVILIIEKQYLLPYLNKAKVLNHVYVLFLVAISFVIFNAKDMSDALLTIGGMFGLQNCSIISHEFIYYLRSYLIVLFFAVIGATPFPKFLMQEFEKREWGKKTMFIVEPISLVLLLLIMTAYLVDGSFNPFLYFRF